MGLKPQKFSPVNFPRVRYVESIGSVILVKVCIVAYVYMLSIQVTKYMIKSLPLLGAHLASRAIKQLNEQIGIAVFNIG